MLTKLALRNAKRSFKDYIVYIVTMTIIFALVIAFNIMATSGELLASLQGLNILIMFIVLSSFLIFLIVIWLVKYMTSFMLTKRSREFAIYMLQGITKKQIRRMFRKESLLLGAICFAIAIIPGQLLQTAFLDIIFSLVGLDNTAQFSVGVVGVVLSAVLLGIAYIIALASVMGKFRKMAIINLINMEKQAEPTAKSGWAMVFVPISIAYIVFFNVGLLTGIIGTDEFVLFWLVGLAISIYLLFVGLSAFLAMYIEKKPNAIYKQANTFILRQLSSKMKAMRFTMGTLTTLFTMSLFGLTLSFMFLGFQQEVLQRNLPVDIMIFHNDVNEDFVQHTGIIQNSNAITDSHIYRIFHNANDTRINDFLVNINGGSYHDYDTYMLLRDYNAFRRLAGLPEVLLGSNEFIINVVGRTENAMHQFVEQNQVSIGGTVLALSEIRTDFITQNGMNGADYIVVVPDEFEHMLTPFYSMLAANIEGSPDDDLFQALIDIQPDTGEIQMGGFLAASVGGDNQGLPAIGSSGAVSYAGSTVVIRELENMMVASVTTSIIIVLSYVSFVFICVALTVLAIQQLSDATRFKFRYDILKKLGLSKKEVSAVLRKQLALYYILPFAFAVLITLVLGLVISHGFASLENIQVVPFQYYAVSVGAFGLLYAIYFIVTYLGFKRQVNKGA